MKEKIPIHESPTTRAAGSLDFRPQDGKTDEFQFAIIAFVTGYATPGLYINNRPVLKHPIRIKIPLKKNSFWSKLYLENTGMQRNSRVNDHTV